MRDKFFISRIMSLAVLALVSCQQGPPLNTESEVKKDSGTSASIDAEVPEGFRFLKLETFSCGGQSNTVEIFVHDKTGLEFILIPGGTFMMGSDDEDNDEKPLHRVTIKPFMLCRTECTQKAWDRIGGDDGRKWKGSDLPIDTVSWDACSAWCGKAGLRLPSEAEWEYACRAGTSTHYSFGDSDSDLLSYGWYKNTGGKNSHPVGKKKPNAFGLYDMHGNLWEWCQDCWHENYSDAPSDGSAWEGFDTWQRVYRGGAWDTFSSNCRSSDRWRLAAIYRGPAIGFRPACGLKE